MHDELNTLRRLYGEPGFEGSPSDAQAVPDALAEMKAALDLLPPQRPDPSVIDAVVAAAGEAARAAALAPIRAVYGEEPELLVSERAEAEAAVLAAMKAALDSLPPQRPDPSVIDAVVTAAAQPSSVAPGLAPAAAVTGRAADRPARRETRRRAIAALSAVFAVVLVFGGGLWLNRDADAPQDVAAERFEAEAPAADAAPPVAGAPTEELAEAAPGNPSDSESPSGVANQFAAAPQRSASSDPSSGAEQAGDTRLASTLRAAPAAPAASGVMRAREETLPLADGNEELQLLYLRLQEMQAAQAGLGWDTPPVSLGAAPDAAPNSVPAATGWMQVRVQR